MYSLAEASQMVVRNYWGEACNGIHVESLRTQYRNHNGEFGTEIKGTYFTTDDLSCLGYTVEPDKANIREVIELNKEKK
jgi:hypothetical protein